MRVLIYLFILIQFDSFCQSEGKILFSEKEFCLVNKDSTIIFGTYSKDSDIVVLNGLFSFNPKDTKSFRNPNFTKMISLEDFNFEVQIANAYYENQLSEYSNLFVKENLIKADTELRSSQKIVDKDVTNRYVIISEFLTVFKNDSLSFLKEQFELIKTDTTNYYKLAKNYYYNEDYEKALIYSKIFLLTNKEFNDDSYDIAMIFELSNVAFELDNKYAVFTSHNNTLNRIFSNSNRSFQKTIFISRIWW